MIPRLRTALTAFLATAAALWAPAATVALAQADPSGKADPPAKAEKADPPAKAEKAEKPPADPAAEQKEADALYREVYGAEHDRLAKSGTAAEKGAFAKTLADAAKGISGKPAVVRTLRSHAAEFASADTSPAGTALTVSLLKDLLADAPPGVLSARIPLFERLVAALERQIPKAKPAERAALAGELVSACREWSDDLKAGDDLDGAAKALSKARSAQRAYLATDSATAEALTEDERELTAAKAVRQRLAATERALKLNPDDPAANREMGLWLLGRKGREAEAGAHLAKAGDPAFKRLGDALAKPGAGDLELADAAKAAFDAAPDKTPHDREGRQALAGLAAARYQAVLDAEPDHPQATRIKLLVPKLSAAAEPDPAAGGTSGSGKAGGLSGAKEKATLAGHAAKIGSLDFSPDGKSLVSGDWAGHAKVWEVASGKLVGTVNAGEALSGATFAPDGKTVAGDVGSTITFWDPATGRRLKTERVPLLPWHFRWSPDGKTLACAGENGAGLMDAATARPAGAFPGLSGRVRCVMFSADGRTVATAADDGTARLWDAATRAEKAKMSGHAGGVEWVALSRDGKTVATGGVDKTVRLWDAAGKEKAVLKGHDGIVRVVAFSHDGRTVLSAAADGTVRLWDAATGKETAVIKAHAHEILALAVSPDGKLMATGGLDNEVKLWNLIPKR
jgi:hypothetical protein